MGLPVTDMVYILNKSIMYNIYVDQIKYNT